MPETLPKAADCSSLQDLGTAFQVWVDRDSNRSVIVELLELDEDCQDHEVAERIFRDCAQVAVCVLLPVLPLPLQVVHNAQGE